MTEEKEVKHADLQLAVKDINAVLGTSQNKIAGRQALIDFIINTINGCVGPDPENPGQTIWTDARAGQLAPNTLATYEALEAQAAAQQPPAVAKGQEAQDTAEAGGEAPQDSEAAAANEQKTPAKPKECPEFGKGYDPADPECAKPCKRAMECQAAIGVAAKKGGARGKKKNVPAAEKEERYGYMHAVCDAIRSGNLTKDDLVKKTLEMYVSKGGQGDIKQAERNLSTALRPLLIIGAITESGGIISINPNL